MIYTWTLDGSPVTADRALDLVPTGPTDRAPSLERAIWISLFSDALAPADAAIPDGTGNRQGWWADHLELDGDRIGSQLWMLSGSRVTGGTLALAQQTCERALAWLVTEGVAQSVAVAVERQPGGQIGIQIDIERGPLGQARWRYAALWSEVTNG